jgi:hypothetical protein
VFLISDSNNSKRKSKAKYFSAISVREVGTLSILPRLAENKIPQPIDAYGTCYVCDEFHGKLFPLIADGLNQIIKAYHAAANTLLTAFDLDNNGALTSQELEKNPLLMIAITPDLDLLDGSGSFNPGQDGVKDSFSAGLGFTGVPAIFTVPGD